MQNEPEKPHDAPSRMVITEPDFARPAKPIGELLANPEFPKSALGEYVDIGGYTGVVVEIVNLSLKVRSPEGATKSFNANGLRRIYGPALRPDPHPDPEPEPAAPLAPEVPPVAAPRPVVSSPWVERINRPSPPPPPPPPRVEPTVEPDFSKPIKKITDFIKRPDYPQCLLGEHVEIAGYSGVVVQILNRSLKVRSTSEVTRSYNADALRRLYG